MLLKDLIDCYEKVRSTTSKLEKIDIVASFLKKLDDEDIPIACYILTGKAFPEWTGKELNVGWSTLWDCIRKVSGVSEKELFEAFDKFGDLGLAGEEVLAKKPRMHLYREPLTMREVHRFFDLISKARGEGSTKKKSALLIGLLNRASPEEAKLIIKTITGETRFGFKEGLMEEAISKAFGVDLELVRRAHMLLSDLGEVALIAKKGGEKELSKVSIKIGRPIKHMLAEMAEDIGEGIRRYGKAIFEYKYDGARVEIHKSKKIRIFTRKFEDVTKNLQEVVEELSENPHEFILDGEVIPFHRSPKSFQLLMRRLRRKYGLEDIAKKVPVRLYVFDILWLDGKSLIDIPLRERRELLEKTLSQTKHIKLAEQMVTSSKEEGEKFYMKAVSEGFEGVMIKDPNSRYLPGKRGKHWLKFKQKPESLDLVVIAVEYGHGKRANVLSDYTFAARDKNGELLPVAKAYCGLTDEEIEELTEYFKRIAIKREGRRFIVKPELVVEVKFGEIMKSSVYPSGYALRFPRIERIRWDKGVDEIDDINKLEKLFEMQKRKV